MSKNELNFELTSWEFDTAFGHESELSKLSKELSGFGLAVVKSEGEPIGFSFGRAAQRIHNLIAQTRKS
jgi:hypothetical protein